MFSTTKGKLAEALALVGATVSAQHAIPIYTHLLLEGGNNDLWITGSDAEVTVVTGIETPTNGDFGMCVPAKQFIDLVALCGSEFSVQVDKTRVLVKHGKNSHRIPFRPREEYPEVPVIAGESLTLSGGLLKRMMEASEIAIDTKPDGKFPAMRGLQVSVARNWLHLVGCDGFRLAVASHPMEGTFDFIIPHKAVTVFGKFSDGPASVEIIPQENHVSLRGERGNVISRRLVGKFPDWRLAIPQDLPHTADMSVADLILAIRRVGLASNIRDSLSSPAFSLKFTFTKDELKLEAQSAEKGEATEFIDIDCPTVSEPVVIGAAGRQILEMLAIVQTGHLLLDFKDAVTGLQFRPKQEFGFDYKYVTMPVTLKW